MQRTALGQREAELQASIVQHGPSAETLYPLAYVLFREQKAADSLAAFTRAATLRPPTAEDLRVVALDYVLLDDYADADRWISRSVEGQPQSSEAWYDLGRIRYTRGRMREAQAAFERSLTLAPGSAKVENNLGLALEALGKTSEAINAYRTAIAWQEHAEKPSEQPLLNLGILLANQGQFEQALQLLLEAATIAPLDAKIMEQLGRTYSKLGRLPDAEAWLVKAVATSPNVASTHYLLGQVYRRAQKNQEAGAEFARAAALMKQESGPRKP